MIAINSPVTTGPTSLGSKFKALIPWGAIGLALMAMFQCSLAERNARQASVQTFNISRVATFQESGKILDKKVAAFYDVAAKGGDLNAARAQVREALVTHSTDAQGLRGILPAEASAYTASLNDLSKAIDETEGERHSKVRIKAFEGMILARNRLTDKALDSLN